MLVLHKLLVIFQLLQLIIRGDCERTKNRIYAPISGASCFRRLNGTHQTGCSSPFSGSEGVLHLIKSLEDFDFLLNSPPSPPYVAVMVPKYFTRKNILRLKDQGAQNITGIVIIDSPDLPNSFSNELKCPNKYSSWNSEQCDENNPSSVWNPYGSGLLHENFPFAIYYITDPDEIKKIISCYRDFNEQNIQAQSSRSLCSIQINTFMSAGANSEICIRRSEIFNNLAPTRFCDPLEGKSVYGTLFPRDNTIEERQVNKSEKFILITCRLDTTSMFEGIALGAMDSLISLATLISTAHMLARILPEQNDINYNVLFLVFNGESYDYIGSQRFIYDMNHLSFPTKNTKTNPITMEQIELMIDLGTFDDPTTIDLYVAQQEILSNAKNFGEFLQNTSDYYKLNVKFVDPILTKNLPPTSANSFLRENSSFPVLVLNSKPKNHYMHSIYDDINNIKFKYKNTTENFSDLINKDNHTLFDDFSIQMKIQKISTSLASAVYTLISKKVYRENLVANPVLIDEFLYCFLQSQDCPLLKAASHPNSLPGLPVPPLRYISVHGVLHEAAGWTHRLLGYLLSQKFDIKKENCTHLPLHWFAGYDSKGECRLTTQNYTYAMSPAFLEENYDWKSGRYSTWTESTWQIFSARIYLRPSKSHEALTLSIGIIVMVLSFVLVYFINSRSDILLENATSSITPTQPAAC